MGPGPGRMPMMGGPGPGNHQMSGPPNRPVTNRPLFPSAAQNPPNQQQSIPKPTFPAYSDEGGPPGEGRSLSPPRQPVPLERPGASQKIVHPDDDVSLEEIRSRRNEYSNMYMRPMMGGPNMNI